MNTNKIIAIVLFCIGALVVGCKSEQVDYKQNAPTANTASEFNQETYIWENFLFPTNRTSGAK